MPEVADELPAWPRYPLDSHAYQGHVIKGATPGQFFTADVSESPAIVGPNGEVSLWRTHSAEFYAPLPDDLELLERLHPGADPVNPPWARIGARLSASGWTGDKDRLDAPTLLQLAAMPRGRTVPAKQVGSDDDGSEVDRRRTAGRAETADSKRPTADDVQRFARDELLAWMEPRRRALPPGRAWPSDQSLIDELRLRLNSLLHLVHLAHASIDDEIRDGVKLLCLAMGDRLQHTATWVCALERPADQEDRDMQLADVELVCKDAGQMEALVGALQLIAGRKLHASTAGAARHPRNAGRGTGPARNRRGGRPNTVPPERDAEIFRDFKASGLNYAEFARERGIKERDLRNTVERHRKRLTRPSD